MPDVSFEVGDCLSIFGALPDGHFDSIVTDPPAGIGFMGRSWDSDRGGRSEWIAYWAERLRVARQKTRPGGYALVWALPRTSHWTATAVEDAGWRVTDVITHLQGQGWPKGKGQLKPASEHWILARNGGAAPLQIDACRVARGAQDWPEGGRTGGHSAKPDAPKIAGAPPGDGIRCPSLGSWPTNLLLSHGDGCAETCEPGCAVAELDRQSGTLTSGKSSGFVGEVGQANAYGAIRNMIRPETVYSDSGGASRFFPNFSYNAKAPTRERDAGCSHLLWRVDRKAPLGYRRATQEEHDALPEGERSEGNIHSTVKKLSLCEWLCSLVTPPGGRIGDLCAGSGSIGIAAHRKGFGYLGCDVSEDAIEIARARLTHWQAAVPKAA